MWLDPWLSDAMFFERMADAQRAAERRRLLRLAEPERGPRSWSALVHRLMHVAFMRWVRHQIKRIIRTGYSPGERRTWSSSLWGLFRRLNPPEELARERPSHGAARDLNTALEVPSQGRVQR